MPVLLEGVVRFPSSYEPWYVYKVKLVASPASYEFGDFLFPDSSGLFDRIDTADPVLNLGYAYALEKFTTGDTEVQVAVPGSAVPHISDGVIQPTSLVKLQFGGGVQTIEVAALADIAAGKILGRLRNHHEDHELLIVAAANDVIIILTGSF